MKAAGSAHEPLPEQDVIEASPRSFGLVFAGVFAIVGLWPLWDSEPVRLWSLIAAATFLLVAIGRPAALTPLSDWWQRLARLLHHVVNPVVMGVLFYLVVTPFGLVMRLLGKGPRRGFSPDPNASTYWRVRGPAPPSSMRNQF